MLVHPGGPFWSKKDLGAWSIPKGEADEGETNLLEVAVREFQEETGQNISGDFIELCPVKQPSRKVIHVWAVEHEFDTTKLVSNSFSMEWPRKSGIMCEFPEVDKAEWLNLPTARQKILKGQLPFLDQLVQKLDYDESNDPLFDGSGQGNLF